MNLVFMGTAEFAVPSLEALHAAGHQISLVVCQPDRPKGRGHQLQAPELKRAALKLGLDVFQPERIKEASSVERIRQAACDVLCVVAYGQILPEAVLGAPRLMALNLHASLLPKYRGAAPIEWAIAKGERVTGVSIQKMVQRLDAGDVLLSEVLELQASDDAVSVTQKLARQGADLWKGALKVLQQGKAVLQPQDEANSSYAPLLKKSDGIADFGSAREEWINHFRAFRRRPGFYTAFLGEILKIHRASPGEDGPGSPFQVMEIAARGIRVACGRGESVWLEEVQSPGGHAMPAADWARGRTVALGTVLQRPSF